MLIWRRFLHTSVPRHLAQSATATSSASPLSVLRKKTGYSLSHCRAALQQFNDNLEQAEAWLHQRAQTEGWSRATKLQSRAASQGLIGIITRANATAMVEINCETDFVAKNDKFQQLVSQVAASLLANQPKANEKVFFDKDALSAIASVEDRSKTLADLTALCVGSVGENVVLRRGVLLNLKENQLQASYCHGQVGGGSGDSCRMGKYGALVSYSQIDPNATNQGEQESKNSASRSSAPVTRAHPLRTICQNNSQKPIEFSAYFDGEDESEDRHEYLNGYVYALPSRESAHDLLLKSIATQLERQPTVHLLPMDIRVQTPDPPYIYYPGLCLGNQAPKVDQAITRDPLLIIELVTPTTERVILHEKAMNYQRIPSLQEILYIWPTLKMAHVDRRTDASSKWTRNFYGLQDKIPLLQSIGGGELVLADIFNSMTDQLGRLLAQHIVASRPRTLGLIEKKSIGNDEDRLLYQKWMHTDDKKKTVEMFLAENQLIVNDFVRFECGEELSS